MKAKGCKVCGAFPETYCRVCGASCHEACDGPDHKQVPALICPRCRKGTVLEDSLGDFCSRRYDARKPCDWQGDWS